MNIWLVTLKFQFNIYILDDAAPIKNSEDQFKRKNTRSLHTNWLGDFRRLIV